MALPKNEIGKGTLAQKEAQARGDYLKKNKSDDNVEDANIVETKDVVIHMIAQIEKYDEQKLYEIDQVIDSIADNNKKQNYLKLYTKHLKTKNIDYKPNILPF